MTSAPCYLTLLGNLMVGQNDSVLGFYADYQTILNKAKVPRASYQGLR